MRKITSLIPFPALLAVALTVISCNIGHKAPASSLSEAGGKEMESFVENLQGRDSILIADHIRYGAMLYAVPEGVSISLPQNVSVPYVDVVEEWKLDTLERFSREGSMNLRLSTVVSSIDEGEYLLPPFIVSASRQGQPDDTLHFSGQDILVCTLPVDTATFVIHPLKAQRTIPVTARERLPYRLGTFGFVLLCLAVYFAVKFFRRRKTAEEVHVDPPHIVALRKLDHYRGVRHLEAEEQKSFYSGITDALREYISARYGIGAMEMTTAEIMRMLKDEDIPDDLRNGLEELLEDADFAKFAKAVFDDEHNSKALPFGVRFVTSTYEEQLAKEESARNAGPEAIFDKKVPDTGNARKSDSKEVMR